MAQHEALRQLHRYRLAVSLALLLVTLYFILYSWFVVPPHGLFLGWKPDTQLSVLRVVEPEYAPYVQEGDRVLTIDGQPVRRGEALFSQPWPSSFSYTLMRNGEILEREVPVIANSGVTPLWKLSQSILALAFWGIGLLTVLFARPGQHPALIAGFSFELIGAGLVSSAPAQFGAPGAWIVGNSLIFLFPTIVLFLAFFPRSEPLSGRASRFLYTVFLTSTLLALVAAVEVLFLFPESSIQERTGVSLADILALFSALATIAALTILVVRTARARSRSYARQQLSILLFFFALALVPLLFLAMLPVQEYVFVPYPLLFSLFLLAPAAYFFVLHRHGLLTLDALFSRLITSLVLTIAGVMIYATAAFLLQRVFAVDFQGFGQSGLLFVLIGGIVAAQKPVLAGVDLLLYGREVLDDQLLRELTTQLSASPEAATVDALLAEIADRLQLQQAAVLAKRQCRYTLLASTADMGCFEVAENQAPQQTILRVREAPLLATLPEWVELAIPITVHEEPLGMLLLSRPAAGYFNARQVTRLTEIADLLAFGLLVISLVAATQALSQRMLYEKELQRQQIATEIHNEPLHTLTLVTAKLREYGADGELREAVEAIRQVSRDLRRIITGLQPPALTKSVEWMVREVMRDFAENNPELRTRLDIQVDNKEPLSQRQTSAVFYVLTEALNNVIRHAGAGRVQVQLVYVADSLTLDILDDGVGGRNVVELSLHDLLRKQHLGLVDMHRWASLAEGQLEVTGGEQGGTSVRLVLPIV